MRRFNSFRGLVVLVSALLALAAPAHALQVTNSNTSGPCTATNPLATTTSGRATYAAATAFFTPAATPTDVVYIGGSSSKTIRVLRIAVSSTQTTAGINQWFLIKRSTANSGGTPASPTKVPLDSTNAAATAVVSQYTANPTPGSTVGTIKAINVQSPSATSVIAGESLIHDELYNGQGIVLRGTAEGLALNFNGAAVPPGLSMAVTIYWTEE